MKRRTNTPERLSALRENEIFVFGSNMGGRHFGGAANLAYKSFGAEWGVGEGLTGRSYAIPTLTREGQKMMLEAIGTSIVRMYMEAKANPELDFVVTKIGCGIAGFEEDEIIPLFREAERVVGKLENVILPKGWES